MSKLGESARIVFSCAVMDILFAYLCKCDKVRVVGLDVARGRDSGVREEQLLLYYIMCATRITSG